MITDETTGRDALHLEIAPLHIINCGGLSLIFFCRYHSGEKFDCIVSSTFLMVKVKKVCTNGFVAYFQLSISLKIQFNLALLNVCGVETKNSFFTLQVDKKRQFQMVE